MARHGLPPWLPACRQSSRGGALRIVGLADDSVLRPAPRQSQVVVTVQAAGAQGDLYWLLDGRPLGPTSTRASRSVVVDTPGAHRLTLMDGHGHFDSVAFRLDLPAGTRRAQQ